VKQIENNAAAKKRNNEKMNPNRNLSGTKYNL
jgi:hypothetical protein